MLIFPALGFTPHCTH